MTSRPLDADIRMYRSLSRILEVKRIPGNAIPLTSGFFCSSYVFMSRYRIDSGSNARVPRRTL